MKNWKCLLGLHKYSNIGQQSVPDMVGCFSMVPLKRGVETCERCGKVNYVAYDISTNVHLDETLNWHPELPHK